MIERIKAALDKGGTKKDIAFLAVSAVALIASFAEGGALPVDPAWVAIALCGAPIVVESAKRDFTTHCRLPEDEFYADSFTTEADLAQP